VGKNGCTRGPLALKTDVLAHARRLLGATSSDSGCAAGTNGTVSVSNTGGYYQFCAAGINAASSQTVSYIVLFVSMFVTLCLRF